MIDQQPRVRFAATVLVFGEYRHESLGKRAFGKQPAQQVGDLESNEERVGREPRAERARHHRIADKTENARQQRHAAHRSERFQ